jgi:hypothetical protein
MRGGINGDNVVSEAEGGDTGRGRLGVAGLRWRRGMIQRYKLLVWMVCVNMSAICLVNLVEVMSVG